MAKNLLGRMFNFQPKTESEEAWMRNQAPKQQNQDGLTSVERYLLKQQAAEETTAQSQPQPPQQIAERPPTSVAKYIEKKQTPVLTGVARYLVKQIIPEYKKKAELAAKAAAPTSVEIYIQKVTAAAIEMQPAVPTSVEIYLSKVG